MCNRMTSDIREYATREMRWVIHFNVHSPPHCETACNYTMGTQQTNLGSFLVNSEDKVGYLNKLTKKFEDIIKRSDDGV
jgi:hypothetical protein